MLPAIDLRKCPLCKGTGRVAADSLRQSSVVLREGALNFGQSGRVVTIKSTSRCQICDGTGFVVDP